jgi:hypothetical protein
LDRFRLTTILLVVEARWRQRTHMSRYALVIAGILLTSCFLAESSTAQEYVYGAASFVVDQGNQAMIAADFNGDGELDIAVVSTVALPSSSTVSVLLGTPNGTLAPKVDYPLGGWGATGLAAGDVNGDGKLDLIVAAGSIYILLGNGDGTFQPATQLPISNFGVDSIAVADFNADGKADLAVVQNSDDPAGAILLGNGDGTFQAPILLNVGGIFSGDAGPSIIAGDLNGDGIPDLAVGSAFQSPGGTISVLLGIGNGTFQPYVLYTIPGNGGVSMSLADMNLDGHEDIVAASRYGTSTGVSVLLGRGDGSFEPAISSSSYSFVTSLSVADFNGDGKPDVAGIAMSSSTGQNTVVAFSGNGDGTLGGAIECGGGPGPTALALGDFTHDGLLDIATVGSDLSFTDNVATILVGQGNGKFGYQATYPAPAYPYDMAAADFNGDGHLDVAVTTFNSPGFISIALNNGNGGFETPISIPVGDAPTYIAAGDFNQDGKMDLVFSDNGPSGQTPRIGTLLGNGDGTFANPIYRSVVFVQNKFAIADFNKDGKLDIALTDNTAGVVSIYLGQGDGTFADPTSYATLSLPTYVFAADFNNDGAPDLAVSTQFSGSSILLNNGNGTFQPHQDVTQSIVTKVGDYNNDGNQDLLFGATPPSVLLGNGDGTFRNPPMAGTESLGSQAQVPDFNGDGKADFAVIASNGLTIFLGNGDGTFGERIDYNAPSSPWSFVVGDFSGSGGADIVIGAASVPSVGTFAVYSSAPVISIFPGSLTFSSQLVGTSGATQSVLLSNRGGVALNISNIQISNGFSQQNDCGSSVLPAKTCSIAVSSSPASAGMQTGSLSIHDNGAGGSQVVPLSGAGRDFVITATPNTASISAGQAASYALSISPAGGSTDTVSLTCSGAPSKTTCSITPSSVTLGGVNSSSATVSVSTTGSAASTVSPFPGFPRAFTSSEVSLFCIVFLGSLTLLLARPRVRNRSLGTVLFGILLWAALSCGGGPAGGGTPPPNSGTPSGTFSLTITGQASSGGATLSRTTTLTLNVQ